MSTVLSRKFHPIDVIFLVLVLAWLIISCIAMIVGYDKIDDILAAGAVIGGIFLFFRLILAIADY